MGTTPHRTSVYNFKSSQKRAVAISISGCKYFN